MRVLYAGHAMLWVETGGLRILTDPWFFGTTDRYVHEPPLVTPLDEISSPDIIVLSHAHPDHFHPPSLERLDRDCLAIVPRHFGTTSDNPDLHVGWRNPNLADELGRLGFETVAEVSPGEAVELENGIRIISVASHHNDFPEMGMVIEGPDGVLYNGVDTWPGEEILANVAPLAPDLVFLPFRYYLPEAQWIPPNTPAKERQRRIREHRKRYRWVGPLRAAHAAGVLRPRAVVPGAEGFRDVLTSQQAAEISKSPNYHEISVGEREDLVRLIRRLWPDMDAYPMGPGDWWDSESGFQPRG
jgi:L-ascorbate metabolism protein UlaG (beta-lactamase superfamily)